MLEASDDCLADLFGAVAAHLRNDHLACATLLTGVIRGGRALQLPVVAVMASGEYLRDTAEERRLAPVRLAQILCVARSSMLDTAPVDAESVLLAGVHAYLQRSCQWWTDHDIQVLTADLDRTVEASVRVLAAALAWRAADLGVEPVTLAGQVCLGLARHCSVPA